MRRYYITMGLFFLIAAMLFLIPVSGTTRLFILLADLLVLAALLVYGVSRINSGFFVPATCAGDRAGNLVALTFDDGPDPSRSREIMELFARFHGKASFFLTGFKVEGNENVVKEMAAAGHSIGNHSFSHSNWFPLFRGRAISREIRETNRILEGITGNPVKFFRPPFGVTNPNIHRGLQGTGLKVIGWSIRSFDTRNEEAGKIVRRITRKLRGGDIVLLHETSGNVIQVLEQLLPIIGSRGLKCVSLDQMAEAR